MKTVLTTSSCDLAVRFACFTSRGRGCAPFCELIRMMKINIRKHSTCKTKVLKHACARCSPRSKQGCPSDVFARHVPLKKTHIMQPLKAKQKI